MKKSRTLIFTLPLAILLAGFVAYQYGYVTIQERIDAVQEERAVKMKTLEKYVKVIAEKGALEDRLARLEKARKRLDANLIAGETPSLAAASLLDIAKSAITAKGGRVSSERVGKTEEAGEMTVVNVNIDAVIPDPGALAEILYALESRTPSVVVSELEVRVVNIRSPREINAKMSLSALKE